LRDHDSTLCACECGPALEIISWLLMTDESSGGYGRYEALVAAPVGDGHRSVLIALGYRALRDLRFDYRVSVRS
jgi:hypothetical protein